MPTMRYADTAAALKFLVDGLGFTLHARYDGPDGKVQHAELVRGTGVIMIGPHPADDKPESGADMTPGTASTYVVVDADADVDAVFAAATRAGAIVVRAPKDVGWGGRSATVRDAEGHYWSVGSYNVK